LVHTAGGNWQDLLSDRIRNLHGQQFGLPPWWPQQALLIQLAPEEDLIGIHTMSSRHASNGGIRQQAFFHNAALLLD
jgi:hypothetical protein